MNMINAIFIFGIILPTVITVLVFVLFLVCCFKFKFRDKLATKCPQLFKICSDSTRSNETYSMRGGRLPSSSSQMSNASTYTGSGQHLTNRAFEITDEHVSVHSAETRMTSRSTQLQDGLLLDVHKSPRTPSAIGNNHPLSSTSCVMTNNHQLTSNSNIIINNRLLSSTSNVNSSNQLLSNSLSVIGNSRLLSSSSTCSSVFHNSTYGSSTSVPVHLLNSNNSFRPLPHNENTNNNARSQDVHRDPRGQSVCRINFTPVTVSDCEDNADFAYVVPGIPCRQANVNEDFGSDADDNYDGYGHILSAAISQPPVATTLDGFDTVHFIPGPQTGRTTQSPSKQTVSSQTQCTAEYQC